MKKISIDGFKDVKKVHLIGVGGVSMSAIAQMLHLNGYEVTGSDNTPSEQTEILQNAGIPIQIGHDTKMIDGADVVIYSAAIPEDDPERVEAKKLNIPSMERGKFIGMLTKHYSDSISISGTHGKTTTTSLITDIFLEAQLDPTVQVGAYLKEIRGNYRIGKSDYFILESCEYKDSFLYFYPKTEIILNIDADHLDYFKNIDNVVKSFKKFTDNITNDGMLIINSMDVHTKDVIEHVEKYNKENDRNIKIYTFGIDEGDFIATDIRYTDGKPTFIIKDTIHNEEQEIELNVSGSHNVLNSTAAYAASRLNGIDKETIAAGMKRYYGAHRRFEYKGSVNGAKIYDDYAHHPTEVKALSETVKNQNYNKSYAIFEPHTFSRTKAFYKNFAESLSNFDNIVVTKIYPAREKPDPTISGEDIVKVLKEKGKNAIYLETFRDIKKYIYENVKENDLVITIGAGDVTNLGNVLSETKNKDVVITIVRK